MHSLEDLKSVGIETSSARVLYLSRSADRMFIATLRADNWSIVNVATPSDAMHSMSDSFDIGLMDLHSDFSEEQVPILEKILSSTSMTWLMLLSEEQLASSHVRRLIAKYCIDYLKLPASSQQLVDAARRAQRMHVLLHEEVFIEDHQVIGNSEAIRHLSRTIAKVSSTTASVLILGESGTGKELTANAIHKQSNRRNGPFIAINCGALPHSLVQSELFGYERGAFTGANHRRIGKIEAAHQGTLFLDEIGDLPLDSQANLLRFLQEGTIERLGSHDSVSVDVRVISATHVDIEQAVRNGQFRADLYHRLCVLRIDEPPLRARGTDIELLANHMLDRFRHEGTHRIRGFSRNAIEALYSYSWPGNVRELMNRVRRAIVMTEGPIITAVDLELAEWANSKRLTLAQAREQAEQAAIQQALHRHGNRLNVVAQELGISRVTLYRLLAQKRARHVSTFVAQRELCSTENTSVENCDDVVRQN